ncbi:hypothetical protein ACHQM5_007507 [Ranunculus cassubicifolius]
MGKSSFVSTKSFLFISVAAIFVLFPIETLAENVEYHNGGVFSGNLDLSILWYGRFGRAQKRVLKQFIHSLNVDLEDDISVSKWWNMVEQYQSLAGAGIQSGKIRVRIVKEQTDIAFAFGKILNQGFIEGLVQKVAGETPNSAALIFTDMQVSVHGTCPRRCSRHEIVGKTLYMVVGNPETKCPNECGWPFVKPTSGPQLIVPVQPPNGNVGTDSMVIALAAALAETVSNPYNNGLYGGQGSDIVEAVSACPRIFGSNALY